MSKKFTPHEQTTIRAFYPTHSSQYIATLIDRSPNSIRDWAGTNNVRKIKHAPLTFPLRAYLSEDDGDLVVQVCKSKGTDISTFVRNATIKALEEAGADVKEIG